MKIKNYIKKGKKAQENNGAYRKNLNKPVKEAFLMEAGQGKHVNGNVFALIKEIRSRTELDNTPVYLAINPDIKEEAKKKIEYYGLNVILIERESNAYKKILATAKYLVTDNSFPQYFVKRDDQIYVNTWHGTPIKVLGRSDIKNSTSIGNVQNNFLKSDYLLFPNEYTKDVMMKDYMINKLFKNETLILDYPRNDFLFNSNYEKSDDKKYIAYMPTWRGTGRSIDIEKQAEKTKDVVRDIANTLNDDEVLYVNLHFLLGDIDFSDIPNVRTFPKNVETYEFLAVCDTLITDYSSVMFDYALTGKKVVLYMYDYDEYLADKGFYFDIKTLPFSKAYDINELKKTIHSKDINPKIDNKFIGEHMGEASLRLIDLMVNGARSELNLEDYENNQKSDVYYAGSLNSKYVQKIVENQTVPGDIVLFGSGIGKVTSEFISEHPELDFIRVSNTDYRDFKEKVLLRINNKYGKLDNQAKTYYENEFNRLFGSMNIKTINVLSSDSIRRLKTIAVGPSEIADLPAYCFGSISSEDIRSIQKLYKNVFGPQKKAPSLDGFENRVPAIANNIKVHIFNDHINIKMRLMVKHFVDIKPEIRLGNNFFKCNITHEYAGKYLTSATLSVDIPIEVLTDVNNYLDVLIIIDQQKLFIPITKAKSERRRFILMNGKTCGIRNKNKRLCIEFRDTNVTDHKIEQFKLYLAYILHIITPFFKPVVMYEKNCEGYEESASVLFEELRRKGYNNVYYILDGEKDDKHVIKKYSFMHYYLLIACETIISTESIGHSLEKYCNSKVFLRCVYNGGKNYVFLQHGVMYMVSLGAAQRTFFQKRKGNCKQRVVVSSQREADHFLNYTNYNEEDIYITGLAKFDNSVRHNNADKIVIMLTWRPWEVNLPMKETSYYKMINRIINTVPDELRDKLVVLPHPLFKNKPSELWSNDIFDRKYNDILKDASVLITDYSSIAYDAFYRGANVIFCWEELDECMKHYGEGAELMLKEDLAFGPVNYDCNVSKNLKDVYMKEHKPEYIKNYSEIVEFQDGRNTERIIEMLEKDELIKF